MPPHERLERDLVVLIEEACEQVRVGPSIGRRREDASSPEERANAGIGHGPSWTERSCRENCAANAENDFASLAELR